MLVKIKNNIRTNVSYIGRYFSEGTEGCEKQQKEAKV